MISHPKLSVTLEPINEGYLTQLFTWRNSPEIFKWCRQNDLINWKSHVTWYEKQAVDPKIRMYLICDSNIPVGVCGLTDMDFINQRAEFSLYIAPEHQKNGYGENALKLLLWHGFNSYPLNIIWGESFEGNPAMKVFERIGFKKEGNRREFYYRQGKHVDAVLYSIKKSELKIEEDEWARVVSLPTR